jgi:hypothetical protein
MPKKLENAVAMRDMARTVLVEARVDLKRGRFD